MSSALPSSQGRDLAGSVTSEGALSQLCWLVYIELYKHVFHLQHIFTFDVSCLQETFVFIIYKHEYALLLI